MSRFAPALGVAVVLTSCLLGAPPAQAETSGVPPSSGHTGSSAQVMARPYTEKQLLSWRALISRQRCLGFGSLDVQDNRIEVGTLDPGYIKTLHRRILHLGVPADAFKVVRVVISLPEGNPRPPLSKTVAVACQ